MIDQLIIGDKASYDDFEASIFERKIGQPKKKSIKATVPFSNKTYDFSAINGEVYWEERELEYTFEITAPSPEKLEELKAAFAEWIMTVNEEQIHDPFILDFHFIGTFSDMEFADDEGLDKTSAIVKFTAYPYKISNIAKKYVFTLNAKASQNVVILNDSSHRLVPTLNAESDMVIIRDSVSYAFKGEVTDDSFILEPNVNSFTIQNPNNSTCSLSITFCEEVL